MKPAYSGGSTRFLRRAMFLVVLVAIAGCSDVLAVAGLSRLDGVWTGRYESGLDFYLDLDDDLYGLYGRAGIVESGTLPDARTGYIYVDGERDGSRVVFRDADDPYGGVPLFEGHVSGRDRIDGLLYLDVIPRTITLRRR